MYTHKSEESNETAVVDVRRGVGRCPQIDRLGSGKYLAGRIQPGTPGLQHKCDSGRQRAGLRTERCEESSGGV